MRRTGAESATQPTDAQYSAFGALFAHFNRSLFDELLEQPMLVFSRRKMTHGHFVAGGWEGEGGRQVDEISLNPDRFSDTEPADLASTLVHEMCHQLQHHHGRPGRAAYHNREFAEMMEARGLITTSTGKVGGKRTGQTVDHLIQAGGVFEKAFAALGTEAFLPFRCLTSDGRGQAARGPDSSKTKYESPSGKRGVWGAPGLVLVDGLSGELLAPRRDPEAVLEAATVKVGLLRAVGRLSERECRRALEVLEEAEILSAQSLHGGIVE